MRYLNHQKQLMRLLLFILLFISSTVVSLIAQEKETINLTIEITVTKHHKGQILFALYNQKEHYMKEAYKSATVTVENGKATIEFKEIEKGAYAFSLFHDVNNNNKLDTNFFGIPKEPYGFSNNQKGSFGPPKFEKALIEIHQDKHIEIHIK